MLDLTPETPADWWEVEALFDLCFAPGREALSSYRLRDDATPVAALCFLIRDETGALGGAIRYWPVNIAQQPALLLGPVAVHPTRQGEGLGGFLIRESLKIAQDMGHQRVMLIGDAPYYEGFGFSKLQNVHMPPPTNPNRILGISLSKNAWNTISGPVEKPGFTS